MSVRRSSTGRPIFLRAVQSHRRLPIEGRGGETAGPRTVLHDPGAIRLERCLHRLTGSTYDDSVRGSVDYKGQITDIHRAMQMARKKIRDPHYVCCSLHR